MSVAESQVVTFAHHRPLAYRCLRRSLRYASSPVQVPVITKASVAEPLDTRQTHTLRCGRASRIRGRSPR